MPSANLKRGKKTKTCYSEVYPVSPDRLPPNVFYVCVTGGVMKVLEWYACCANKSARELQCQLYVATACGNWQYYRYKIM